MARANPSPASTPKKRALKPADYLQKILNARVYDVANETELELARNLTRRLGNEVWLKREDGGKKHDHQRWVSPRADTGRRAIAPETQSQCTSRGNMRMFSGNDGQDQDDHKDN